MDQVLLENQKDFAPKPSVVLGSSVPLASKSSNRKPHQVPMDGQESFRADNKDISHFFSCKTALKDNNFATTTDLTNTTQ